MRNYACLGWITAAALLGCDAKVDERYRGEPMLRIAGSVVIDNPNVSGDLVPALAFTGESAELHILDVDTLGEFPASFTLQVMSPPPAAALYSGPEGMPSFAIGHITALPEDHPPVIQFPEKVDGTGGFSWCNRPDNTDCYRRINQCIAGTDQCFNELRRCKPVKDENGVLVDTICDEILESSGDPTIANAWAKFAGLSERHFLVYVSHDAPADAARSYLHVKQGWVMALVFGRQPIPAGYHLVHSRPLSEQEDAANDPCQGAAEAAGLAKVNAAGGTSYASFDALAKALGSGWGDHPLMKEYERTVAEGLYDGNCFNDGVSFERIAADSPVEITIGTEDVRPAW